jgi:glycosyltransferase involved in cell wall biosynthesis
MKAILVSKRFHPGHASHLEANAKLLKENGFDVSFLVSKHIFDFSATLMKDRNASFLESLALRQGDLFVVWFPSLSVVFNLLLVRLFTMATTVYICHEPYTSFSSYRQAGFGVLKALRVKAIATVSSTICTLSRKIIFPSSRAFDAFQSAIYKPERYAKIDLMFADESEDCLATSQRDFVSYIGTIAEDHAFDEFVCLMKVCIDDQLLQPLKFMIATRSQIPPKYSVAISECLSSGRLVLQSGTPMTNKVINHFYSQSFVVWNAYKRSMQSGVLPKAYMFGTPVLVSTSNTSEHFEDGVHGVLISNRYSVEEFCQAISKLQLSWSSMSQNCRNYYLHNFDYHAISANYMNFVTLKQ